MSAAKKTNGKGSDAINDSILEVDCEKKNYSQYQVN